MSVKNVFLIAKCNLSEVILNNESQVKSMQCPHKDMCVCVYIYVHEHVGIWHRHTDAEKEFQHGAS